VTLVYHEEPEEKATELAPPVTGEQSLGS